jgi:hypothetical protein
VSSPHRYDTSHGAGIDWICSWYGQDALPISRYDAFALTDYASSSFFECVHSPEMWNIGDITR